MNPGTSKEEKCRGIFDLQALFVHRLRLKITLFFLRINRLQEFTANFVRLKPQGLAVIASIIIDSLQSLHSRQISLTVILQ